MFDYLLVIGLTIAGVIGIIYGVSGIRIIRPTNRAVIERFGKYRRFRPEGMTWVFPGIEKLYSVNITEQMTEASQQEIITLDNLNASVDAQVYYKVRPDEESVKASFYGVYNYRIQIIALAKTTLRNVIGSKNFAEVNSKRVILNNEIKRNMEGEVQAWGVEIVRCELKQISPPKDVQETMNRVLKAQNEKEAAIDFANAKETQADGEKRSAIKIAEGKNEAMILDATAKAESIRRIADAEASKIEIVNEAARRHFRDNAVVLKTLEVNESALKDNSKIILTNKGVNPSLIIGDGQTKIVPVESKITDKKEKKKFTKPERIGLGTRTPT
jgi:regulator of protease activity HflC (stomatin/prohibitin superfamily)